MNEVVVVGESLIDILGDRRVVGGGPLNIAMGLARLDDAVALLSSVGRDSDGLRIERHLDQAGVRLVAGSLSVGATSTAQATLDSCGSATYVFDISWKLPRLIDLGVPSLVHVGSLGVFLEPGASRLLTLLDETDPPILTFDPNLRPALLEQRAAADRVAKISRRAAVVKLSDEDAAYVWPGLADEDVAELLLAAGVELVVLTKGARGSRMWTQCERVSIPAFAAHVVDTIGAGDSYMAGLIHGILRVEREHWPDRLHELGSFATACASLTLAHEGAFSPTIEDVKELLEAEAGTSLSHQLPERPSTP